MKQYTDRRLKRMMELVGMVQEESKRQIEKWGIQEHSLTKWFTILAEDVGSIAKAINNYEALPFCQQEKDYINLDKIVDEAIQVATLCLKIVEMIREE